jgi:hypothetical protein
MIGSAASATIKGQGPARRAAATSALLPDDDRVRWAGVLAASMAPGSLSAERGRGNGPAPLASYTVFLYTVLPSGPTLYRPNCFSVMSPLESKPKVPVTPW